ncbi:MAG: [FeFe] hydrogenase maturase subunit HydE [Sporomusa sp.]|nr:[FeFe] hydrogenase maturase subunit HydE [Sporomusa sp.]
MTEVTDIQELIKKAETTHELTKREIVTLLTDNQYVDEFFAAADRVRQKYVGNDVHLRGLIEFSNICKQNCLYCGLRRDNKKVDRYRLDTDTIMDFAVKAKSYGYRTVVLQSGEDECFDVDTMVNIIKKIKELGLAITLSVGEKTREVYQAYREAGADRYLLRIETTDKELYEKLDPGMSWDNRVRCLNDIKELGFELGTGCLVGIPGQTIESLADDILFFKQMDADMIGVGPFIPNPDTPLAAETGGTFELSTKVMAMTRLLLPDINIPATTAMESLNPQGRVLALQRGANVVMPNVTEGEYRQMYLLYPGKICINDTPAHCRSCITGKIQGIGRKVSETHGFRAKRA